MSEPSTADDFAERAREAAEAIRELNHRTRDTIAAPQAYELLGYQGYRREAPKARQSVERGRGILPPTPRPGIPEATTGQPWQRPHDAPHRPEPPGLDWP